MDTLERHTPMETQSLSDFQRDAGTVLVRARASGAPILLRQEDGVEIVIQDAEAYRAMWERLQLLEDVEALREGLEDIRAGRTRPAEEVFTELRRKHGISG